MADVLESAANLQKLVPDAVLVGGSAAALYAHHRRSNDHVHDLGDLQDRFDAVLDALESEGAWVTNRVTYGKIILGQLGDIEAGVRQLIRKTPLEVAEYALPSGAILQVPTLEETIRIKAFLAIRRNQTRDYLDIAALAETLGEQRAAEVLSGIDRYYADQRVAGEGVSSQIARQLSDPRPVDGNVTQELSRYKGLAARWHRWRDVAAVCQQVADLMVQMDSP